MLLQSVEKLDELIVKSLCHRTNMSADEIRADVLARSGHSYTAQAIFKELQKLQASGIVVRLKGKYNLFLSWALRLVTLADVVHDVYLSRSPLDLILAERAQKRNWRCADFDKVGNFWVQAKIAMLKHERSTALFEWQPHPWTTLLQPERQVELEAVLRSEKARAHVIVGGRSALDRALSARWARDVTSISHNSELAEELDGTYITVVGEHIFSCEITPKHHHKLDELFASGGNRETLAEHSLFREKAKFAVKLERNAKKARRYMKMFEEYFV